MISVRIAAVLLVACLAALPVPAMAQQTIWEALTTASDGELLVSFKYKDQAARARIMGRADRSADLPFISRVVASTTRDNALSLEGDEGILDLEIISEPMFHKLLELYRIYLYQVSGAFRIAVVNLSQNVKAYEANTGRTAERSITDAVEVVSSRIAPVLIAAGDTTQIGGWASAPSVIPVVATTRDGQSVLPQSARPVRGSAPWHSVLYVDGAPRAGEASRSQGIECGEGNHLTADQMLAPETAAVPAPGGSSFATFKATASVCYIHQYAELVSAHLRYRTPVGYNEVEPFLAYYVDSPVNQSCRAMQNRWADKKLQNGAPRYNIAAEDKMRMFDFVNSQAVELRTQYSPAILKAFLRRLPERSFTNAEAPERTIDAASAIAMLRRFTMENLIRVAGNATNVRYSSWLLEARKDPRPLMSNELVDAIVHYCATDALFMVLAFDPSSK